MCVLLSLEGSGGGAKLHGRPGRHDGRCGAHQKGNATGRNALRRGETGEQRSIQHVAEASYRPPKINICSAAVPVRGVDLADCAVAARQALYPRAPSALFGNPPADACNPSIDSCSSPLMTFPFLVRPGRQCFFANSSRRNSVSSS